MIDTYKTAKKFCHVKGRGYNTQFFFIISIALDVTEGIFAVLYVSVMALHVFIIRQFFLHLFIL